MNDRDHGDHDEDEDEDAPTLKCIRGILREERNALGCYVTAFLLIFGIICILLDKA